MKKFLKQKVAILAMASATLVGCHSAPVLVEDNYLAREAAEFQVCHDEAFDKINQAQTGGSAALHHVAAVAMQNCLADSEHADHVIQTRQAMQASAITLMSFVRAGEIDGASDQLANFKQTYPSTDLYFADGTSFIDSARLLLGEAPGGAERGSLVNARAELKSELRRNNYWQSH